MYKRILLKISGEALKNDNKESIFDIEYLKVLANKIKELHDDGIQIAIVVGAGNIWRGKFAKDAGLEQESADYMGMLGTVINATILASFLNNLGVETEVFSALSDVPNTVKKYEKSLANQALNSQKVTFLAGGTGKPFFTTDTAATMRALELDCEAILMGKNGVEGVYDKDPSKYQDAKFIKEITYDKIIQMGLQVMDITAVELIKNSNIDIRVFSMSDLDNFKRVVNGEDLGTTCHREGK